tara:strand:- start:290 stop:421 length:132 start_codon:yes stop_codon:yes gene_type:complete
MTNKQVLVIINVYFGAEITTIISALFNVMVYEEYTKREENCAI